MRFAFIKFLIGFLQRMLQFFTRPTRIGCHLCDDLFRTKEDLQLHIAQIHDEEEEDAEEATEWRFCYLCRQSCRSLINHHFELFHVLNTHRCRLCDNLFRTKTDLQLHIAVIHDEEEEDTEEATEARYCYLCRQSFSEWDFARHFELDHPFHTHLCIICENLFRSKAELQMHIVLIHDKEVVDAKEVCFCYLCHQLILNAKRLFTHFEVVHPDNKHWRLTCYNLFRTEMDLLLHTMIHVDAEEAGEEGEDAVAGEAVEGDPDLELLFVYSMFRDLYFGNGD